MQDAQEKKSIVFAFTLIQIINNSTEMKFKNQCQKRVVAVLSKGTLPAWTYKV